MSRIPQKFDFGVLINPPHKIILILTHKFLEINKSLQIYNFQSNIYVNKNDRN